MVWAVATDFIDFAGIFYFFGCLLVYTVKEGEHIHDGLVVLPTVSFCEYLFGREKNGT